MDVFAFVRRAGVVEGEVALAAFSRFAEGLPAQGDAVLRWSARGEVGRRGVLWLHLAFAAQPTVLCQRCLTAFAWSVDARVTLEIVASEAELTEVHGLLDDTAIAAPEKVLGSDRFDLLAQIEDELILAVPHVTRHDVCPEQPGVAGVTTGDDDIVVTPQRSPFAALQALKNR